MMNYAILTVVYHETADHYQMALKTWDSFPADVDIFVVVNRRLPDIEYPAHLIYLHNDENCLAKAWNMGLTEIFKSYDYAIVSGLDSLSPTKEQLDVMIQTLHDHPKYGVVSATPMGLGHDGDDIQHGDGSFSFFAVTKETFAKVKFDERFKPAYFEDNAYLEDLKAQGYTPKQLRTIVYYHVFQGTFKFGTDVKQTYFEFMQRNLELYKSLYGKVPDHLPDDVSFI